MWWLFFSGFELAGGLVLALIMIYLFLMFWDFIMRIRLFKTLKIGGFIHAIIPFVSEYKLGESYRLILEAKGIKKARHAFLPFAMLFCSAMQVVSLDSLRYFANVVRLIAHAEKYPEYSKYIIFLTFLLAGFICIILFKLIIYVWTAILMCTITGEHAIRSIFYLLLPYLRSSVLLGVANIHYTLL